jgi:ZIP family zinc transporter
VSVWAAVAWGAFTASSLLIGALLAGPLGRATRTVGLITAFGAGTLLSAIAYQLVPLSTLAESFDVGLAFLAGALVYFVADHVIDSRGGSKRQAIAGHEDEENSGVAMFLGALLDGVPETVIVGITLALGGSISVAFVVAVFVSNIPEGIAGSVSLQAAGLSRGRIYAMWGALVLVSALGAGLGFALSDELPHQGDDLEAFAGGAMLAMLANSMMPEAFKHGGRMAGLLTVLGYLVAAVLAVADS